MRLFALASLLLFCLTIQPLSRHAAQTATLVNVCAANYSSSSIALDSIVAAFGVQLATTTVATTDADPNTPGIQLPTTLGGTTVRVADRLAPLFFVSPGQVNYLMPPELRLEELTNGAATVEVRSGAGVMVTGSVLVKRVAPAIFSFDSSGQGLPAGQTVRVKSDLRQIIEPIAQFAPGTRNIQANLIDLSPTDERVFLVFYVSGVRNASDPNRDGNVNENIHVLLNEFEVTPYYAGLQLVFAGLDQINVEIPRAFLGQADLRVAVKWIETPASEPATIIPLATPPLGSVNWMASGLNNRMVNCLAANESVFLAGTEAGIFRSADGANWTESNQRSNTLALLHAAGNEFYASANIPLRSVDNGANWATDLVFTQDVFLLGSRTIFALAQFNFPFAGTDQGLFYRDGMPIRGLSPKGNWGGVNFPGVPVKALTKNFGRTFAGTEGQGVFSGNLNGLGWTASNQGLPANAKVRALTASAHYVFAAITDNGLYRSTDSGVTWAQAASGLPVNANFTALAGYGRNILVGAQSSGIYLSTDYGQSWRAINNGLSNLNVLSLFVSNRKILAGTTGGVFAVTNLDLPANLPTARTQSIATDENKTVSFSLVDADPRARQFNYIVVTPPANGALSGRPPNLTYTPHANFKGTDTFTFVASDGQLISQPASINITVESADNLPSIEIIGKTEVIAGEVVYLEIVAKDVLGSNAAVSVANWPAGSIFSRALSAITPNRFHWTADQPGLYQFSVIATSNGPNPVSATKIVTLKINSNLEKGRWSAIALPTFNFLYPIFADTSGIYLGGVTNDSGPVQSAILRSLDNGVSWIPFNSGLPSVNAPQKFTAGSNHLYVGTQNGVWRTFNTSANWTEANNGLSSMTKQVWDLAASGDKVAVATPAGCYLSTNRGENWTRIRDCLNVAFNGNTLFITAVRYVPGIPPANSIIVEGLFASTDDGATWKNLNNAVPSSTSILGIMQATADTIYVGIPGQDYGFAASTDQGATFTRFSPQVPRVTGFSITTAVARQGNTIFIGTRLYGVYVSRDNGATWLPANLNLPQATYVTALALRGDRLFAVTNNRTLFVRKVANE